MEERYAALAKFMRSYADFSSADVAAVSACWRPVLAKAGDQLLVPGQVCRHVYFLHTGLMRYFYIDEQGEEVTKFFTEPPYVFTAQRSLNLAQPSQEGIAVVQEAELLVISKADVDALFRLASWSTFVRKLVQEVQYFTEQILLDAQALTAEERYKKMLIEQPNLVLQLSQKHIASYLGIAPQSLSRIRARVAADS